MKYGFFDDKNKEYVITTPKTPLPWINYLGSNDFFGIISVAILRRRKKTIFILIISFLNIIDG